MEHTPISGETSLDSLSETLAQQPSLPGQPTTNTSALEESVRYAKQISQQLSEGDYVTAAYLIDTAGADVPKDAFYAAMAVALSQKAEELYRRSENSESPTAGLVLKLADSYKAKCGYLKTDKTV